MVIVCIDKDHIVGIEFRGQMVKIDRGWALRPALMAVLQEIEIMDS